MLPVFVTWVTVIDWLYIIHCISAILTSQWSATSYLYRRLIFIRLFGIIRIRYFNSYYEYQCYIVISVISVTYVWHVQVMGEHTFVICGLQKLCMKYSKFCALIKAKTFVHSRHLHISKHHISIFHSYHVTALFLGKANWIIIAYSVPFHFYSIVGLGLVVELWSVLVLFFLFFHFGFTLKQWKISTRSNATVA